MQPENSNTTSNPFRLAEKKYKRYKTKPTDFSSVIDLNNYSKESNPEIEQFEIKRGERKLSAFRFQKPEGLLVIKNYTTPREQLEFAQRALDSYICKPHRTNLFIYEKDNIDKPAGNPTRDYNKEKWVIADENRYFFNTKIRWSNLGRQYDWTNRGYHEWDSKIPKELKELAVGVIDTLKLKDYSPEALIINYYNWKNNMGGHLDDGEPDQIHPIVSFSFGLSCVFLIGGADKSVSPQAIRLDSGDVMIMSEAARRCVHGVPRILEGSVLKKNFLEKVGEEAMVEPEEGEEKSLENDRGGLDELSMKRNNLEQTVNYLCENRINMNFRQVVL